MALAQSALLVAIFGSGFGRDVFRLAREGSGFAQDLGLQALRGLLFVCGNYLVYPLAVGAGLLAGGRVLGDRLMGCWRFWMLLAGLTIAVVLSPFPEESLFRTLLFGTYVLPVLVAFFALGCPAGAGILERGILVFGAVNILMLVLSGQMRTILSGGVREASLVQTDRLVIESDSISTAVNFYVFGLAGLLAGFSRSARPLVRIGGIAVLVVSVGLALFTGSRGPLISFVVALVAFALLRRGSAISKLLQVAFCSLILAIGFIALPLIVPPAYERLATMAAAIIPGLQPAAQTPEGLETDERFSFYRAVVSSRPTCFGQGIGAFGDFCHRPNEYVHNLFLEAYFETGIAGLLLLSWAIAACFRRLLRAYFNTGDERILFCVVALTFYFVEAQFSSTLLGNKGLLPFMLLGYCVSASGFRPDLSRHKLPLRKSYYALS